jgi:hypothetical protein
MAVGQLGEQELMILEIESLQWRFAARKEQVIRDQLGLSAIGYYQILNRLLDSETALAAKPMVINRLRRIREMKLTAAA